MVAPANSWSVPSVLRIIVTAFEFLAEYRLSDIVLPVFLNTPSPPTFAFLSCTFKTVPRHIFP